MAIYSFNCDKCKAEHDLMFGMNDDEGRANAKCPDCGGKLKRNWQNNIPHAVIMGSGSDIKLTPNQTLMNVDGQPVKVNFIDHGDRSGLDSNGMASKHPGARLDEKTGKAVVDVVSTIPDPLGARKKGMEKGSVEKKQVGQKFKTRK